MADLKLPKLPDRTPVKLTVSLTPELKSALDDYLAIYRATYLDEDASVAEIVPAMLETFLTSDRGFGRARAALKESR